MSAGNFRRCTVCDEYGWFDSSTMGHRCQPAWDCRMDDGDDSWWKTVHARDAEAAAEKFASFHDTNNAEYAICSGSDEPIVLVRKAGSAEVERWQVSGEMVPSYRAEKAEEDDPVVLATSQSE